MSATDHHTSIMKTFFSVLQTYQKPVNAFEVNKCYACTTVDFEELMKDVVNRRWGSLFQEIRFAPEMKKCSAVRFFFLAYTEFQCKFFFLPDIIFNSRRLFFS